MNSGTMEKSTESRICTKCTKELDIRYFEFRSDTKKYRNHCKLCNKGYKELREDKILNIIGLAKINRKECSKCLKEKHIDDFHKDKHTLTGYTSICKECKSEYTKENKEVAKFRSIKNKYNLGKLEYSELIKIQNGKCAICKKNEELVVDHNHKTKEVRGLLCWKCNVGLGHFNDNPEYLKEAINYLEKSKIPMEL